MAFLNRFNKSTCKIHLRQVTIVIALFLLITVSCIVGINSNSEVRAKESNTSITKSKEKKKEEEKNIKIDVKGAVVTPGVYELPKGSRVIDAINIAGGLVEGANTSIINLSKILEDGFVVVIYTNQDLVDVVMDKYVQNNYACPSTINDACIVESENSSVTSSSTKTTSTKNSKTSSESTKQATNNIININTASLEELQTIQGIGLSKAQAIIQYREENGGFKSIDELTNVSGIGESTLEKIKSNITI